MIVVIYLKIRNSESKCDFFVIVIDVDSDNISNSTVDDIDDKNIGDIPTG